MSSVRGNDLPAHTVRIGSRRHVGLLPLFVDEGLALVCHEKLEVDGLNGVEGGVEDLRQRALMAREIHAGVCAERRAEDRLLGGCPCSWRARSAGCKAGGVGSLRNKEGKQKREPHHRNQCWQYCLTMLDCGAIHVRCAVVPLLVQRVPTDRLPLE